jgi:hypothetical protein
MTGGAMTRIFPILLAAFASALVPVLRSSPSGKPTTGTRITLGSPRTTVAAAAPFSVEHGFPYGLPPGKRTFVGVWYLHGAVVLTPAATIRSAREPHAVGLGTHRATLLLTKGRRAE